jgi:hypothetical protein
VEELVQLTLPVGYPLPDSLQPSLLYRWRFAKNVVVALAVFSDPSAHQYAVGEFKAFEMLRHTLHVLVIKLGGNNGKESLESFRTETRALVFGDLLEAAKWLSGIGRPNSSGAR